MSRRRLVTLVSAFVLLGLGLLAFLAVVSVTKTEYGREQIRRIVETGLKGRIVGSLYIGEIRGGFFTDIVIDSLEIRDADDSLFVATGPISIDYDPRDILDKRILLSRVVVERPVVHITQFENGDWNWKQVFPRGAPRPKSPERNFGDFIVARNVTVRDGAFRLRLPWHPADSLSGARRDSAVAHNMEREDAEIRRVRDGLSRTYHWTDIDAKSGYVRLADPDSTGRFFAVDELDVDESDPPFRFSDVRGAVRILEDSVLLDLAHFELPGSRGAARGHIAWGDDKPMRWDLRIRGDTVSLADIAWIYPTLPRTGGGKMRLRIRNDPRNLRVMDYVITELDVRADRSRLRGAMTFAVGGPVLAVKDVNLVADPVNFDLLRTLAGGPFTVDWQGDLRGTVRGPGGPVNRFRVADARLSVADAHVRGAVSRFTGRGELDIFEPAFTVFRGFDVETERLDLRTIQHLFPEFPRLGGTVAGRATLDSLWLDVRFSEADVRHVDGPGTPSRATGSGRVTLGETFTTYDLELDAQPLSLTTLARSYPDLPFRGTMSGPLTVRGTLEELAITARLAGDAGGVDVDATFDVYEPGYGAIGAIAVSDLDVRTLLDRPDLPATRLNARASPDLIGDSLATLAGRLAIDVDRSEVDGMRVYPSRARLRFADGRVLVDTLRVETAAAQVVAFGALGLHGGVVDSLAYEITVDSLGGLRRWIFPAAPRAQLASTGSIDPSIIAYAAADSLAGVLRSEGVLVGSVDSLAVRGALEGRALFVRGHRAARLGGSYGGLNLLEQPRATATLELDTLVVGGIRLSGAELSAQMVRPRQVTFSLHALSENGPQAVVGGILDRAADTTVVTLQDVSLLVHAGEDGRPRAWRLVRPGRLVAIGDDLALDTLVLTRSGTGRLVLGGRLPAAGAVDLFVRADSLPLADLGLLAQRRDTLDGRLGFQARVTGLRAAPRIEGSATLTGARFGGLRLERIAARARYADRRLEGELDLLRGGSVVLAARGAIPVDLALVPVADRLPDGVLSATVRADSVDLAVLEMLSPELQRATGRLDVDVDVGGTWERPRVTGRLGIANGEVGIPDLGIRLVGIASDVFLQGDSLHIRRLVARSGAVRGDTASLTGFVRFDRLDQPVLGLRLATRGFTVMNRPRDARLVITSNLALDGPVDQAFLSGGVTIVEGEVRIPELFTKQVVELDVNDPDFYQVVDTTLFANRTLVPQSSVTLLDSLDARVTLSIGQDVWLRSEEANIQLSGELAIRRTDPGRLGAQPRLALSGALSANRGTYRLNLGVVQRTFEVDRGEIRFAGGSDLDPGLDISAVHTVRQPASSPRPDVRIRVDIGGTLENPTLRLRSDEGLPISESDLVSYLVTGAPAFGLASFGERGTASTVSSVLLPSAGSVLANKIPAGLVDVLEVQTAGLTADELSGVGSQAARSAVGGIVAATRLSLGWQIGSRTFVSTNFGLCSFAPSEAGSDNDVRLDQTIGAKIEHRFNHGFSAELSSEPATSALLCSGGAATRGFAPTNRQFGFDLFKTWQF